MTYAELELCTMALHLLELKFVKRSVNAEPFSAEKLSEIKQLRKSLELKMLRFMPNYNKPKSFDGQILCWNKEIEY